MAAQRRLDEGQAPKALLEPRHPRRHDRLAPLVLSNVFREVAIQLSKSLDESFRMTGRQAGGIARGSGQ